MMTLRIFYHNNIGLNGGLTCPSLQDDNRRSRPDLPYRPLLVVIGDYAGSRTNFFGDIDANSLDSFSASPADSPVYFAGKLDQTVLFPFAICFFALADRLGRHSIADCLSLDYRAGSSCSRRTEMFSFSLFPPGLEEYVY